LFTSIFFILCNGYFIVLYNTYNTVQYNVCNTIYISGAERSGGAELP